jgi:hypothetical protein
MRRKGSSAGLYPCKIAFFIEDLSGDLSAANRRAAPDGFETGSKKKAGMA